MASDAFDELERLFGLVSQGFGAELGGVPVDLLEDGDAFVVRADLPGYRPSDVDVTLLDPRRLRITAERERDDADGRYRRRERRQHTADRTVSLPEPVDETGTTATYDAGVLTVRLARRDAGSGGETDVPVG